MRRNFQIQKGIMKSALMKYSWKIFDLLFGWNPEIGSWINGWSVLFKWYKLQNIFETACCIQRWWESVVGNWYILLYSFNIHCTVFGVFLEYVVSENQESIVKWFYNLRIFDEKGKIKIRIWISGVSCKKFQNSECCFRNEMVIEKLDYRSFDILFGDSFCLIR